MDYSANRHIFFISVFIFFVFSCFTLSAFSQSLTWQKLYRGYDNYDTYGADICRLNDGGFLIISNKYSPNLVFIIRANKYGSVLDTNIIYFTNSVTCAPTNDNGCIIIGYEYPPAASVFAAKINSSGRIVWKKNYDSTEAAVCNKLIRTNDNKYICCGQINYWYGFAMKIEENGNLVWKKIYPIVFSKSYKWVCESNNTGYFLVGSTLDSATSPAYGVITKIDTSGNVLWERRYKELFYTMCKLTSNYLLSIYYPDTTSYQRDHSGMLKIDESGNILTKKIYFVPGYEVYSHDCKVVNSNKYLFLNYRQKLPNDTSSAYAFFTDSSGNVLRTYVYGGFDYSRLNKAIITSDGGFAFAGTCNNITPHVNSVFVVKADSNLYAPPVGIFGNGQFLLKRFTMVEAYPNPFNNTVKISIDIAETGDFKLVLYDILGNEVMILHNGRMLTGKSTMNLELSRCSSGIYFVSLSGKGAKEIRKIVLIK